MSKELTLIEKQLEQRKFSLDSFQVIKKILYPAARDETLLMALDYCKSRNLDIMKKPIQIVPIWDQALNDGRGGFNDTIWQSIVEIRITAFRTGAYVGRDEAIFGEDITETYPSKILKKKNKQKNTWEEYTVPECTVTYPSWCQVIVYRLVQGVRCPFSVKIRWKETYKTAGRDNPAPNEMWKTRPFAQLEKCAEAAALRAAFPEEIGSDYIIDEMREQESEPIKDITPDPSLNDYESSDEKAEKAKIAEQNFIKSCMSELATVKTIENLNKCEIKFKKYLETMSYETKVNIEHEITKKRAKIEYNNSTKEEVANV